MYNFPIGVLLESFRTDAKSALAAAKEVGATGVQVHATYGFLAIDDITASKIKEFKAMFNDSGLVLSALCGDFGGNFSDAKLKDATVEKSKRILDLAKELGTDIVTTHIGVVPVDHSCDKFKVLQDSCGELAAYADSMNAHFAIETGPEIATTLKSFLDTLHSRGVGVNLDPANFIMVTGDDPAQAVHTLKDYIVHTHAKDGRRLIIENPEIVYGEIEAEIKDAKYFIELPLGDGDVPFPSYLKALDDIGYKGFLTIEREVGDNPKADIIKAVNFLNELKNR